MIKGVNKKILEINNPQSLYFEKAVLYLKPNMNSISYKLLRAEAQEMIQSMSPKTSKYNTLYKLAIVVAALAIGFGSALVTYLFLLK